MIKKVGDKYVVYGKSGGKRLGTHNSRKKAEKQLAAIEISKNIRGEVRKLVRSVVSEATTGALAIQQIKNQIQGDQANTNQVTAYDLSLIHI